MLTTILPAQVVEFRLNRGGETYTSKEYLSDIDSIIYVPAQDWNITAEVDSFYEDGTDVHVLATITVGPNADVARAGFGSWDELSKQSVPFTTLEKGTTQTVDLVVPDASQRYTLGLYTENRYYARYSSESYFSGYYTSITVDYADWKRNKDWKDAGMALYREDLMTTFFSVDNPIYQVPIQEHKKTPGLYRLVNPYGTYYPYNESGDYDPNAYSYMLIHAEDPAHVWVEDHETTMDWSYGRFFFTSMVAYYLSNGNSMEAILSARPDVFGTLQDGIITMPERSMLVSMADYNDANLYYANNNGLFAIALPGHELKTYDYTADVSFVSIASGEGDSSQAVVDITLGTDVALARYALTSASLSESDVANAIANGDIEAEAINNSGRVYLPLGKESQYRVTVVTYDADGKARESASTTFEFEDAVSWKSIGMGIYTDDIVGSLFGVSAVTYEVEVYANENNPGIYRLKNPYGEAFPYNEPGDWDSSKDYFLEINAEDPTSVYFEEQELGVNWGYGMMSAVSNAARYLAAGYDVETIKANGIEFGTLQDGIITFPVNEIIVFDDDGGYYGNTNGAFRLVLPGSAAGTKARQAPERVAVQHGKHKVSPMGKQRLLNLDHKDRKLLQ